MGLLGVSALMRLPIGGFPAPTALSFGCQLGFSELSRQGVH